MNAAVLFSSATDEWATPQDFYEGLRVEFDLWVDAAATKENAKSLWFFGPGSLFGEDGLMADWTYFGCPRVWCNPPYSRGLQGKFIAKAAQERERGVLTVMLLPARTDTKAFHRYIYDASTWAPRPGVEIRLIPGRLKFGGAANSAPFPSMVVIFRPTEAA
jgi:phage N-6-adenine-methyltransferase